MSIKIERHVFGRSTQSSVYQHQNAFPPDFRSGKSKLVHHIRIGRFALRVFVRIDRRHIAYKKIGCPNLLDDGGGNMPAPNHFSRRVVDDEINDLASCECLFR
jgi:hypothetical protein